MTDNWTVEAARERHETLERWWADRINPEAGEGVEEGFMTNLIIDRRELLKVVERLQTEIETMKRENIESGDISGWVPGGIDA